MARARSGAVDEPSSDLSLVPKLGGEMRRAILARSRSGRLAGRLDRTRPNLQPGWQTLQTTESFAEL